MNVNRLRLFDTPGWLDERSFETIFFEHYPRIYAILFRLVGDRMIADDLTADTFWKLWEKPPGQNENIAGWLYRVALRLGYNALRAARRREQRELQAGKAVLHGAPSINPSDQVETQTERERVRAALRKLSQREVQILLLRNNGLSYKEIAAAVGVAPSSVGSLLARAEAHFEALYQREEEAFSASQPRNPNR